MAEEKFKLRLDIKTGDEDIDLYLWSLHEYLVSFETSSIKQLIISLDRLSQKLCDDIDMISDGTAFTRTENEEGETVVDNNLTILSSSSYDKTFDRILALIGKIESFKKISELAESLRPDVAERKEEIKELKPKIKGIEMGKNPFEALQERKLSIK